MRGYWEIGMETDNTDVCNYVHGSVSGFALAWALVGNDSYGHGWIWGWTSVRMDKYGHGQIRTRRQE